METAKNVGCRDLEPYKFIMREQDNLPQGKKFIRQCYLLHINFLGDLSIACTRNSVPEKE